MKCENCKCELDLVQVTICTSDLPIRCPICDEHEKPESIRDIIAERDKLKAEVRWWQDREANIDEAIAKQRAVPSSELVRECSAVSIAFLTAMGGKVSDENALRVGHTLANAAARIDALEQELVPLRELRRLAEARDALMSERDWTGTYNEWFDQLKKVENEIHSHVRKMREGEA